MSTSPRIRRRALGSTGLTTSVLGLGCMGMSDLYGPADEAESVATIHAALDAGVTLLDTGDFYGMGHNELLIHDALRGRDRDSARIIVAVKGTSIVLLATETKQRTRKSYSRTGLLSVTCNKSGFHEG